MHLFIFTKSILNSIINNSDNALPVYFIVLYPNKKEFRKLSMIKANREIVPDRKLFQILYNYQHTSGLTSFLHSQSHQQTLLNNFMTNFINLLNRTQSALLDRILSLQSKLQSTIQYCARLHAIILSKVNKNSKLYSFANSPLSKNNESPISSASKRKQPQSIQKYKGQQYSPSIQTQPQTNRKVDIGQPSPFFAQKISQLQYEISQLHQHMDIAHPHHRTPPPEQSSIKKITAIGGNSMRGIQSPPYLSNSFQSIYESPGQQSNEVANEYRNGTLPIARRLSSLREYWQIGEQSSQDIVRLKSQLERCRAVIKQYEYQQSQMKRKMQKYKGILTKVLDWLRNLKEVQLKSYLPCEACNLKQIIRQYLEWKPASQTDQKGINRGSLLIDDEYQNYDVNNIRKNGQEQIIESNQAYLPEYGNVKQQYVNFGSRNTISGQIYSPKYTNQRRQKQEGEDEDLQIVMRANSKYVGQPSRSEYSENSDNQLSGSGSDSY